MQNILANFIFKQLHSFQKLWNIFTIKKQKITTLADRNHGFAFISILFPPLYMLQCTWLPLTQICKIMHITWFCQFQGLFSPGHIVPLLLQTVELALKDGQVLQSNVRSQLTLK